MTLGFKPEFVSLIIDGTKIHTIRSGQRWNVGQPIQFCAIGPQGEQQQFRPAGHVTAVQAVRIRENSGAVHFEVDGRPLLRTELCEFARRDGFESPASLLQFLTNHYKLPFEGQLVHWTDMRY